MQEQGTTAQDRDGFVISTYDGDEVDFVACSKDGRMREKVEIGLAMRVDLDRFTFADTRDLSGAKREQGA